MFFERFVTKTDFDSYEDFRDNFCVTVPDSFNFAYDVVDEIALQAPDRPALVWCNDAGETCSFSFLDMQTRSCQAARFFASRGIKKGDAVMLMLKRRYEFWFCLLGLHRIGAICIPSTHMLTSKDICYRVHAADVRMIVAVDDQDLIRHVEAAHAESVSLLHKVLVGASRDGWDNFCAEYTSLESALQRPQGTHNGTSSSDTMLIFFTSGTTGMPKMVRHTFAYPLGHIVTAGYWQSVLPGKLHLTLAETGWAKALWGKIYGQWLCGCAVLAYDFEKFNPKNLLNVLSQFRVATFCAPPTVYRLMMEENFQNYDLTSLQHCSIAGEAFEHGLINEFYNRTGLRPRDAYGQTETTVLIGNFPWMDCRPGSMGKPAPEYLVELLNEQGSPCGDEETGEIVLRVDRKSPAGLFKGYYSDQDYTEAVWHDGYYYTGDLAWRDKQGYYWFVGRADTIIKSSGYRIGPFEVESVLLEHPAVQECVVTSQPDPDRGQAVKAIIVLHKEYSPSRKLIKNLQEYVKTVTAPYKYPRYIEFAEEIPKTFNGKKHPNCQIPRQLKVTNNID